MSKFSINSLLKKKEDPFFQKNEDGRDLFYPCGYPGEASIISKKIKKLLKIYNLAIPFFFILIAISTYVTGKKLGSGFEVNIYIYSLFLIFPIVYIAIVEIINIKKESVVIKNDKRPIKKINITFIFLSLMPFFLILFYIEEYNTSEQSKFFITLLVFYQFFIFWFIFLLKKSKGYIFNK